MLDAADFAARLLHQSIGNCTAVQRRQHSSMVGYRSWRKFPQGLLQVLRYPVRVKVMSMPRQATAENGELFPVACRPPNFGAVAISEFCEHHGVDLQVGRPGPSKVLLGTPSSTGLGTGRLQYLLATLADAIPLAELLLPLAVCGHIAHCRDVLRLRDEAFFLEEVYA